MSGEARNPPDEAKAEYGRALKDLARRHAVEETLSKFAVAYVEVSVTEPPPTRDHHLGKRKPVMQRSGDRITG